MANKQRRLLKKRWAFRSWNLPKISLRLRFRHCNSDTVFADEPCQQKLNLSLLCRLHDPKFCPWNWGDEKMTGGFKESMEKLHKQENWGYDFTDPEVELVTEALAENAMVRQMQNIRP